MEHTIIDTYVIKGSKYAIFILLYIFVGVSATAIITVKTHLEFIAWIGMFLSILVPGIFESYFRKRFIQEAQLLFTDESLSILLKEIDKVIPVPYAKIQSVRVIDSTKDDSSFLRIFFKDGTSVKFTFVKQTKKYLKISVSDVLFQFLKNYNNGQSVDSKITVAPSLFARKSGKIYIYIISVLLIICITLQIFLKPVTIPFSFLFAIMLYLVIIVQKKRDVEISKKLE